ncbi:glycosyl transferase family 1 [Agromyces rhizosphaerae]|uniref:Glycosyl transferase family 1 n=1 Tax=Agromyces rhizosphaerae TaxID=88374 RepID=A0A9W6FNS3_9MICO|nr:glycosyltransferase [Agromyces rhizosphaerae]GLI26730.1 glycosyl transferase family 1 [Agromyces rhizosphaerae]
MSRVLVTTVGSRGDVQPYLALAKGLQGAGHDVTLATCERFGPFAAEHGVPFVALSDEILQLLDTDAGRDAIEESTGLFGMLKTNVKLAKAAGPINERLMHDVWAAAQAVQPEVMVYHPKALAAPHVAEKLGATPVLGVVVPATVATRDFPIVGLPAWRLGAWYNRLTYRLTALGYANYDTMVNRFRTETLGLPKRKGAALAATTHDGRPVPVVHGISEQLLPRPADWPEWASLTGYWFLDAPGEWTPSPELVEFLEAGDSPVYVGFGSMAGRNPERLTRAVVEALETAGLRGVIATGWGGMDAGGLPDTVLRIDEAPHDWIFPRVAAVVHHGGAGTTAAGLRAGRPTVVCPFIVDQFFWGCLVAEAGVGSTPVPQKQLTGERLAAALREVTTDAGIRERADAMGRRIRAEDGVAAAVAQIEGILADA